MIILTIRVILSKLERQPDLAELGGLLKGCPLTPIEEQEGNISADSALSADSGQKSYWQLQLDHLSLDREYGFPSALATTACGGGVRGGGRGR